MSCPAKTAITDSELNQTYTNKDKPGILPSSPPPSSDRDGNGMLKDTSVKALVGSLKNSGVIPTATPKGNPEEFMRKQQELLKNIESEYCFYEARYKYALEQLMKNINIGYMNNTGDVQSAIQSSLASTQALNQKLNDLTQIINGITEDMLASTNTLEAETKALDKKMKEQKKKLDAQNKIITSNQAVTELNKEMVKFTEQKAKYSNNLLGLYSFLNVVALGLLIYVYKSARD
jgi:hypothetical protein